MFLLALTDPQHQEFADKLQPLLKNPKFWKFGKHSVGMVCCILVISVMYE